MPAARSELAALAQRLAALAPALVAAITATTDLGSPAHIQGRAACLAASACIHIGIRLQLKGSDALRVAAAARLLLLAGKAALVAGAARQNPAYQEAQKAFKRLPDSQLSAIDGCMSLMADCERPDAIAVFAATTAAPAALLPWLAAASDALLLACHTRPPGATTLAVRSPQLVRSLSTRLQIRVHASSFLPLASFVCCRRGRAPNVPNDSP